MRYMQFLSWAHGKIEPDTKTVSIARITLADACALLARACARNSWLYRCRRGMA